MTETNPPTAALKPLLTPAQAAAALGITSRQLEAMRGAGTGPAYARIGHKTIRYSIDDLREFVAACRRTSTDEPRD